MCKSVCVCVCGVCGALITPVAFPSWWSCVCAWTKGPSAEIQKCLAVSPHSMVSEWPHKPAVGQKHTQRPVESSLNVLDTQIVSYRQGVRERQKGRHKEGERNSVPATVCQPFLNFHFIFLFFWVWDSSSRMKTLSYFILGNFLFLILFLLWSGCRFCQRTSVLMGFCEIW